MPEGRRRRAERLEELDLRRGIGDMVLAANDMGDAEIDVVDHARQGVEIAAIGAHQHGIGQRSGIDMLAPRTRSSQTTSRVSSLKRQWGLWPSASSLARSSSVSFSAARS